MVVRISTRIALIGILIVPVSSMSTQKGHEPMGSESDTESRKQKSLESYFDDIMINLPGDVKAQLDTTKGSSAGNVSEKEGRMIHAPEKNGAVSHSIQLEELPDQVKKQVEKAIRNIDSKTKQRELEFKQMQLKKPNGQGK